MLDKRNFFLLLTSATLSGVLVICTLAKNIYRERVEAKAPTEIIEIEKVSYVLRAYENQIGVFRGQSEIPYKIIPFNISMLSDYDKEQIIEGIEVETEAEINKLVEDFTS